jgi:DNA repair exonuclease SbcCD nuclease subunit
VGAQSGSGYNQQPRYADRISELVQLLDAWIAAQDPPIDFVLHGGDMIDATNPRNIRRAKQAFSLTVPVYLCLGNHDLTTPDALDLWLSLAPEFFCDAQPVYTLANGSWMLHIVPNQWCETPFYWRDVQRPHLLPDHWAHLASALFAYPDRQHLLCTHAEVLAVPADQVGRSQPYHPPLAGYATEVRDLATRHSHLRGVLSGHSHVNTHGMAAQAHAITGSAFSETPFEFKDVVVGHEHFTMRTVPLLPAASFKADYNWDRTFVQGRHCDRGFEERL